MAGRGKVVTDRARCRECPLWEGLADGDGHDILAPLLDEKGERVMKQQIPQFWKHKDGAPVRWGVCGAKLPRRDVMTSSNGQITTSRVGTSMRETRSDWFCESKEKHEALARLKEMGR